MADIIEVIPCRPQALILSGLPASGKSLYAKEWVAEDPEHRRRINWDDLRLEMFGPDWKFNRKDESKMKVDSYELAKQYLAEGMSVVIDNTNLTERARGSWRGLAQAAGAEVIEHELDTPAAECVMRDRKREGRARVGRAVIERMALFNGFIDWADYPNRFIVCDVDGTLSDPTHRLHLVKDSGKKDWDKFHDLVGQDTLKEPIARLVGHFRTLGYHILICSGRWIGDRCGKDTEDWLDKHNIQYDHLFMRDTHDSRPDFEIKQEILDLLPKDKIAYVLDDRSQVVEMWRRNGLICLQVSTGDF